MQTIQRILIALWSALTRAFQFWARDIAKRKTLAGKAFSGCLGIFVILCACSMGLAAARGAGEAVGLLPTRTPTSAPTARPSATVVPLAAAAPTPREVATTPATTAAEAPASLTPTLAPTAAAAPTQSSTPTPSPPTGPPASPPGSSQAVAGAEIARPVGLPSATVARVIDGDTVDVSFDGQTVRVRLIGIDTPETVDPRKPVECFGREASAKAHELLDGQTVSLEEDPSQDSVDRYGRALRYVWLADGRLFNLEMVAQGYAFEYTYEVPYTYQALFKQAERDAREQQRGLWAESACNGEHRPADTAPANVASPVATLTPLAAVPAPPTAPASAPAGGVTITREPGTVRRGATASVAARTAPGVQCSIVVRYKSGPSQARGLEPKSADAGGDVSWSWMVGTRTTPGAWPVIITCGGAAARTEVVVP